MDERLRILKLLESGRIGVSTLWGDITVKGWEENRIVLHPPIDISKIGEDIEGETFHGDIKVDFEKVEESEIKTKFGDITLIVPEEESLRLDLNTGGEIECDLPLKEVKRGPTYLEGIRKKGEKLLSVIAEEDGNIIVRQK